jgi:hypothetical protein
LLTSVNSSSLQSISQGVSSYNATEQFMLQQAQSSNFGTPATAFTV